MEERKILCKDLVSQKELCSYLGVSRYFIYRAIKKGLLKVVKVEGYKDNFFKKEDVDKWIDES